MFHGTTQEHLLPLHNLCHCSTSPLFLYILVVPEKKKKRKEKNTAVYCCPPMLAPVIPLVFTEDISIHCRQPKCQPLRRSLSGNNKWQTTAIRRQLAPYSAASSSSTLRASSAMRTSSHKISYFSATVILHFWQTTRAKIVATSMERERETSTSCF